MFITLLEVRLFLEDRICSLLLKLTSNQNIFTWEKIKQQFKFSVLPMSKNSMGSIRSRLKGWCIVCETIKRICSLFEYSAYHMLDDNIWLTCT